MGIIEIIDLINEKILWGVPMLSLFIGVGIYFTAKLGFFQFNVLKILKETLFLKNKSERDEKSLSPFQTLTSTLAVTLGTGNIAALGTAIVFGGAGAVFWLWVSAFLGMATTYAENYLGMLYRRKGKNGYISGVFYYIEAAAGKAGGAFFAICCILAGIGMGNMTQINTFAKAANSSFNTPLWLSGAVAAVIVGIVVFGGVFLFSELTERVIPFISVIYIIGCLAVIVINANRVPDVFLRIFSEAFGFRAIGGAVLGNAVSWGFRRGVFSNEAGLGSSVILNSMSAEKDPRKQSLWATLAVFIDTIVICTLTALIILLTGAEQTGAEGTALANVAFESAFNNFAGIFVTISIAFFALSTTCGWSVFGAVCLKYLFGEEKGENAIKIYLVVFTACCFIGAVMDLELVWGVADIFNGLMAVPNLLSVIMLRKKIKL